MNLPNPQQVKNITGHIATAAGTAIAIFGLQAKGIDPQKMVAAINAMGDLFNSLVVVGGILGALFAGYKSATGSSPTAVLAQAQSIAEDPTQLQAPAIQQQLVGAVKKIAEDPGIAIAQQAKAAIIDAAAAVPEVVGEIKVADAALAAKTASPQVVTAP